MNGRLAKHLDVNADALLVVMVNGVESNDGVDWGDMVLAGLKECFTFLKLRRRKHRVYPLVPEDKHCWPESSTSM